MKLKHILIALSIVAIGISSYVFSEFLLILLVLLKNTIVKSLMLLKGFVFKGGVVSLYNVYWKKVLSTSSLALLKRVCINSINRLFTEYFIEPVIQPLTRYVKVQWLLFKKYSLWKKLYSGLIGAIPASIILWLVGVVDTLLLLTKSLSLAKFLTAILKLFSGLLMVAGRIWKTLIQPYLDVIVVGILVNYVEKTPFIGYGMRWVRVNLKLIFRRFRLTKKKVVDKHVVVRINTLTDKINKYVDEKENKP